MTPLAQAILDRRSRSVREILRATPEAAREISLSGRTMLELARAKGSAEIVAVLCASNVSP
jgi:hypothetical protein